MADFTKRTVADMAAATPDINMGTSGSMREVEWGTEDAYWREEYARRPYSSADRSYEHYQPAYRYGHEARTRYAGRDWDADVERDLETGWHAYRGNTQTTWAEIKDAVKDAFGRGRK